MAELKKMKIIPLKDQTRLVSIEEFDQQTILFPLDKKKSYSKYLRLVLEDTPIIDERLLDYIEEKYPRRSDSIKRLLRNLGQFDRLACTCSDRFILGITDASNIRRIYSNHILPVLKDDAQWSSKSDAVLIAYMVCIYKNLYAPAPEIFMSENENLKIHCMDVIMLWIDWQL
jgi:hypothetical protein